MACVSGPTLRDLTPPKAGVTDAEASATPRSAVISVVPVETLKTRVDFVAAAKGRRMACPAFLLQARQAASDGPARVGFTCSKKVGNAVTRNRAKRRLRAIARAVLPAHARPGWDYVLVGRPGATVSHDFAALCHDLETALVRLHGGGT